MPGYYLTGKWVSPLLGFPAWLLDPPKRQPKITKTVSAPPVPTNVPRSNRSSSSDSSFPVTPHTPTTAYWLNTALAPEVEERERLDNLFPSPRSMRFDSGSVSLDGHGADTSYRSVRHQQSISSIAKASVKSHPRTGRKVPPKVPPKVTPTTHPIDTARHDIVSTQEMLITKLTNHFSAPDFRLPSSQGSRQWTPLTERELMWLSRECFIRFLKATKNNYRTAISRMERALVWRRTQRFDDVEGLSKELEREFRTGKHVAFGFTRDNWPILYSVCNRNTTPWEEDRAQSHMFMVERTIDLMADGVTQMVILFTFFGEKLRPGPPWPVSTFRGMVEPFYEFYPDILGMAVVQELPWWARLFVNIVWPFVPNRLRRFTRFLDYEETRNQEEFSPEQLLVECGGDLELPWDYDSYWPTFIETIIHRREEHLRRWRELGPARAGYEEKRWKVALPTAIKIKSDLGLLGN